ncbi:MAG: enoyl-CoA hydratase-related protein [Pseudomonadota bacterium]
MIEILRDERTGRADVLFDRPAKLNALTVEMWRALAQAYRALSAEDDLRVVVLSGRGRAFCVGADIAEFETERAGREKALAYGETIHAAVSAIAECRHPTVAAIKGHCVGGGVEIAAYCDLRVAAEGSVFGVPIKKLGLPVDYPELAALRRLVGPANALELLLEGRLIDAETALAKGLVNRVVPLDAFEAEIDATAARIAEGAPLAARWHKRMLRALDGSPPLSEAERAAPFEVFDSKDYRIGTRAFIEKRDPSFVGR